MKQRVIKNNQVPNTELRKAINVRNILKRKYDRCKIPSNWSKYENHRDIAANLRRKSRAQYFTKQCQMGKAKISEI